VWKRDEQEAQGRLPVELRQQLLDAIYAAQPFLRCCVTSAYASPTTHVGYELIGAGMLILAGGGRGFPLDYDELE
jgi:hypothetical protein